MAEKTPKNPKGAGRPRKPGTRASRAARRFYPLEKTSNTVALVGLAHQVYEVQYGKDTTDAEVIREALREYALHTPLKRKTDENPSN